MNINISSENELDSILLEHNPFNEMVIRNPDIWGEGFIDVLSYNSHASDAIFNAMKREHPTSLLNGFAIVFKYKIKAYLYMQISILISIAFSKNFKTL